MSTFDARLAARGRQDLVLWVSIQGVETVFAERRLDVEDVLGEARPVVAAIVVGGVQQGESFLDLEALSEKGGGLTLRLKQPRGSTILVDTFQTLRRRRTYLTADASKTDTTITVQSTTGFTAPGTFFMGAETISFTGTTSTTFTGCMRGAFGSRAQKHLGESGEGTAVYDVAPAFLGRRVKLYGSFLRGDGSTTDDLTKLLGTFSIEQPPTFVDSTTLELDCGPLIDEYMGRKIGVGFKSTPSSGIAVLQSDTSIRLSVLDASLFVAEGGVIPFRSHVIMTRSEGDAYVGRLIDASTLTDPSYVDLRPAPLLSSYGDPRSGFDTATHLVLVGGANGTFIVTLLASRLGDEDNGPFDILPGRERQAFSGEQWQTGAGIDEADIDVDAFSTLTNDDWAYPVIATAGVGDVVKEWCLLADAIVLCDEDGVLTAVPNTPSGADSVLDISASNLSASPPPRTYVDESCIAPHVEIAANWNPLTEEFEYRETFSDGEMIKRYGAFDAVKAYELKGLGVDAPPVSATLQRFIRPRIVTMAHVAELGRRLQKAEGRGRLLCEVSCTLLALNARLGDAVTLDFDAPNYQGGSVRGSLGRVVGRRVNFDEERIHLTVQVLDRVFLFAPSAVVTAVSTTSVSNDTVTLDNANRDGSAASPGDGFAVGQTVRLWDVSAGTSQTLTIAARTATSLRFTASISGTVEANRDWLTWASRGTNTAITSESGNTEDDLLFLEPEPLSDPDDADVRRWR